jgi:hypothetical protein
VAYHEAHILILLTLAAHAAFAQSTPSQAPPKLENRRIRGRLDQRHRQARNRGQNHRSPRQQRQCHRNHRQKRPSTYTVRPAHPAGTSLPGDATAAPLRGAQWTVLEFDIGKKKKKTDEEAAQDNAPPPPPPTVK